MATISKENYLKAIYLLSGREGETISSSMLANELKVSNAAITEMANKLSDQKYVFYEKYKGIKILSKGKKLALNVIRKHRLWELFLVKSLGLKWSQVHTEAEKLEHCSTDFLTEKIDEYLNFPEVDPHGEPIPSSSGNYRTKSKDMTMEKCEIGESYLVARVNDKSSELIDYLSKINISLRKKIKIIDKLNFDGSIIVEVDGIKYSLSKTIVNSIYLINVKI